MSPELPVRVLPPWLEHRYRLISWYDMNKFSAESFHLIADKLSLFQTSSFYHDGTTKISEQLLAHLSLIVLPVVISECQKIGLSYSLKEIKRTLASLSVEMTNSEVENAMRTISQRIKDELEENLFLWLSHEEAQYYSAEPLFGEKVRSVFPSTSYDIVESGKCIALNRNTASVCHSMRVLEIGLRALATRLGVQYENKPWNYVIEVADKKLIKIRGLRRKPRNWKTDEKFYSEAIVHFRFLKDAWRNYSMHVYERYDPESARAIFNHVKSFMQHLATKLKETP